MKMKKFEATIVVSDRTGISPRGFRNLCSDNGDVARSDPSFSQTCFYHDFPFVLR